MSVITTEQVASLFVDREASDAARAELARINAAMDDLRARQRELSRLLDNLDLTTDAINGVALMVDAYDDRTTMVGVHPVGSIGAHRYATAWRNVHTGRWMVIVNGPKVVSGGAKLPDDHDCVADAVAAAKAWVAAAQ